MNRALVFIKSWTGRWYARYAGTDRVIAESGTLTDLMSDIEERGL